MFLGLRKYIVASNVVRNRIFEATVYNVRVFRYSKYGF